MDLSKSTIPNTFQKSFPLLSIWTRLPAFISWIGLSIGLIAGLGPFSGPLLYYPKATFFATFFFVLSGLLITKNIWRFSVFIIAGFFLTSCYFSSLQKQFAELEPFAATPQQVIIKGTVVSNPSYEKWRYVFLCSADSFSLENGTSVYSGKMFQVRSKTLIPMRSSIQGIGKLALPKRPQYSEDFDEFSYLLSQNIYGKFVCDSIISVQKDNSLPARLSRGFFEHVTSTFSSIKSIEYRGVLTAAFTGDRSAITPAMDAIFRQTGIFHLLALSGFNVELMIGLLVLFLWPIPMQRWLKIVTILVCIWSFLYLTGFIPSLFRATLMSTVVLCAFFFQQKNYPINTLGLAGIVWLIISPLSIVTPGYQLSFAATFGIIAANPVFSTLVSHKIVRNRLVASVITFLWTSFWLSGIAFIVTLPVIVYHFGTITLAGLIANMYAVVIMSLCMYALFAGCIAHVISPSLSVLCMIVAENVFRFLIWLCGFVGYLPINTIKISKPLWIWLYLYVGIFIGLLTIIREYILRFLLVCAGVVFITLCVLGVLPKKPVPIVIRTVTTSSVHQIAIDWIDSTQWLIGGSSEYTGNFRFSKSKKTPERTAMIDAFIVLPWECPVYQSIKRTCESGTVKKIVWFAPHQDTLGDLFNVPVVYPKPLERILHGNDTTSSIYIDSIGSVRIGILGNIFVFSKATRQERKTGKDLHEDFSVIMIGHIKNATRPDTVFLFQPDTTKNGSSPYSSYIKKMSDNSIKIFNDGRFSLSQ